MAQIKIKPLNNVFNNYHNQLINLVNKSDITSKDKILLIESLLYLRVITSIGDDDKYESKKLLENYQELHYSRMDPIDLSSIALFYAEKGNYYFKFQDKETALDYAVIREFIKTQGFSFNRSLLSFVKKESNIPFDTEKFLEKIIQLLIHSKRF